MGVVTTAPYSGEDTEGDTDSCLTIHVDIKFISYDSLSVTDLHIWGTIPNSKIKVPMQMAMHGNGIWTLRKKVKNCRSIHFGKIKLFTTLVRWSCLDLYTCRSIYTDILPILQSPLNTIYRLCHWIGRHVYVFASIFVLWNDDSCRRRIGQWRHLANEEDNIQGQKNG